jgi:hypothetical protein
VAGRPPALWTGAGECPADARGVLGDEVNAYIAELADRRDEHGRRLVGRDGYHQPRKVTTAAGVEVKAPRVISPLQPRHPSNDTQSKGRHQHHLTS